MNIKMVDDILDWLALQSVETICLCPGGRNAPFVARLEKSQGFEILSFYDERSAGFFALGRSKRDKKPVALITTSGTAVTEVLSAVVEAAYTETPLIIITADRPKNFRGTGAPQSIEQANIFGSYVSQSYDYAAGETLNIEWSYEKPIHLNICFDEPLIDEEKLDIKKYSQQKFNKPEKEKLQSLDFKNPLIVLGGMNSEESKNIEKCLQGWPGPIFAESLSGLKNAKSLTASLLKSTDKIISRLLIEKRIDSVIRIGDVPVGRFWRDLDRLNVPTLSISSKNFKGTTSSELVYTDLEIVDPKVMNWKVNDWSQLKEEDSHYFQKTQSLLTDLPESEAAYYKKIEKASQNSQMIFVGNSLPIRLWDMVDEGLSPVYASRGVNGIDGQVSSAMGLVQPHSKNWIVLGDLTTLYDFSGFWMTQYLEKISAEVNFVVVNNFGGQIFSRLFESPMFLNSHNVSFEALAKMWGWEYRKNPDNLNSEWNSKLRFIEIQPNKEQTDIFWERYDQIWKK